jgi:hypothetical protein
VAAHQPWTKGEEIPLASRGPQDGFRINPHLVDDECQLVNQGNVEVALGDFDDFGGLDDYALRLVRPSSDDFIIQRIDKFGDFRGRSGGNLFDDGSAVLLIARVDAFGAIAASEAVCW